MKIEELILTLQDKVDEEYFKPDRIENITSINNLIDTLNGKVVGTTPGKEFKFFTADELTRIGTKLAILQYNLIEYETQALKNFRKHKAIIAVRESEIRKKVVIDLQNGDKKISVKDITAETASRLARYEIETSLHEAEFEKLKSMKFGINSITHRIETRIKYLMTDNLTQLKNG